VSIRASGLDEHGSRMGTASITWARETGSDDHTWTWELPEGGDPFAGCVRVNDTGAKCIPAAYIPWCKRQALALAWVLRVEGETWAAQVEESRLGAHLFLPFREAQVTQTGGESWDRLWSALTWQWIMGEVTASRDFLTFLLERGHEHPERNLLARRVGLALLPLLDQPEPDCLAVRQLLERAAGVGLTPDLFAAQNLYWTRLKSCPAAIQAGLALGFAHQDALVLNGEPG